MNGLCIIAANLPAKNIAGIPSNGMVICAGNHDHTIIELCRPNPGTEAGERVYLEGDEIKIENLLPKLGKKELDIAFKVIGNMKTDNEGYCVYKGKKMITSKGYIKSLTLKNADLS